MADLTTTIHYIKRLAVILIFLSLVGILLVTIFYQYREKPPQSPSAKPISPPIINQDPSQKQPQFFDFAKAQIATIPENLPVFSAEKYNLTDQLTQNLAASFGFTTPPSNVDENTVDGKQYNWIQNDLSSAVSQTRLRFEKSKSTQPQANLPQNQLQEVASDFIQKIPLIAKDQVLNWQKTKYLNLANGRLVSASSFEESQIIEFVYDKNINDLPLVGRSPNTGYSVLRIKKNGEIIYLSSLIFNRFIELDSYKLKSLQQAIAQVKSGQGKIVRTAVLDENGQALELFRTQPVEINSITFTNISLAYFLVDDPNETIQPIFVFKGKFQKEPNQDGEVVIYLPAIDNSANPKL